MKTLKELADLGAAAALQELKKTTSLNWCMWINKDVAGDTWNDEEPARQAFAQAVRDAVLAEMSTKSVSPTFKAHGFTWNRHKPGDPMPCDGGALVSWLTRLEADGEPYIDTKAKARMLSWDSPVGWRYAEPTHVAKTVPLDINDIRATDEFRHVGTDGVRLAYYWNSDTVSLGGLSSISYAELAASYLRRQHGSTEWKPCTKEVAV